MASGLKNKEIGTELSITQGTVKLHVHNILSKLGTHTRTGAIAKALIGHLL
jgi:DNA-binding NarL/FixJ family response regulator